jgi:twitching motility protein PilT
VPRIDIYLANLARFGAAAVCLESETSVIFRFPTGDRRANQVLAHKDVVALVDEIASPGVATFRHTYNGASYEVTVERGPQRWRMIVAPAQAQEDEFVIERTQHAGVEPQKTQPLPPPKPPAPHLLGRLAVQHKLITMEQLEEATRAQGRREGVALGTILIEQKLITEAQLRQLLDIQQKQMAEEEPESLPRRSASAHHQLPIRPTSSSGTGPLDAVLERAVALQASDVLFMPGEAVRVRLLGQLTELGERLGAEDCERILVGALKGDLRARFDTDGEIDFSHTLPGLGRFRASVYRQHRGVAGVFHTIPLAPPRLEELGLPQELAKLTNFAQGMVLVTGPAGCGKTSTLAALTDLINEERHDHILTIEDPIEYLHTSKRCVVNQRQVRRDTETFARALRAALREDPDVICIGELRDLETISLAMSAAETGHLVLATLHTNNAIRTINRIVGAYPADQQDQVRTMLSESLRAVISQRLLRSAKGDGMVVALEVLQVNSAVANLIRENKTFQILSVLQTGRAKGQRMLDHSLAELVAAGRITAEAAARESDNPQQFKPGAGR